MMGPGSIRIEITIDGRTVSCMPGRTVLEVARENGVNIPTLCHNELFPGHRSGACRICLVEVVAGGRPRLEPSCTLPVSHGLVVSTLSEAVYLARRTVLELLLTEHLQDCRNCPKSGDCVLAGLCRDYDVNGVSVCAECPNQGEGCLLRRGVLCLGPLTYAGCGAFCTRSGYRCEGCHTVMADDDVLRFGLKAYRDAGFAMGDILEAASVFSLDSVGRLGELMRKEGWK